MNAMGLRWYSAVKLNGTREYINPVAEAIEPVLSLS
jgi:hypothetical protein